MVGMPRLEYGPDYILTQVAIVQEGAKRVGAQADEVMRAFKTHYSAEFGRIWDQNPDLRGMALQDYFLENYLFPK